jgi:hypothetical protein
LWRWCRRYLSYRSNLTTHSYRWYLSFLPNPKTRWCRYFRSFLLCRSNLMNR